MSVHSPGFPLLFSTVRGRLFNYYHCFRIACCSNHRLVVFILRRGVVKVVWLVWRWLLIGLVFLCFSRCFLRQSYNQSFVPSVTDEGNDCNHQEQRTRNCTSNTRNYFRPRPGFTVVVIIACAITTVFFVSKSAIRVGRTGIEVNAISHAFPITAVFI